MVSLDLSASSVLGNTAHHGGGILAGGIFTATMNSVVKDNNAYRDGGGGGIYIVKDGVATMNQVTLQGNRAPGNAAA